MGKRREFDPFKAQKISYPEDHKWIDINGRPSQEITFAPDLISNILDNGCESSSLESISLRNPKFFQAGEIHQHIPVWHHILQGQQNNEVIMSWLRNGVDVTKFAVPYKGSFVRSFFLQVTL